MLITGRMRRFTDHLNHLKNENAVEKWVNQDRKKANEVVFAKYGDNHFTLFSYLCGEDIQPIVLEGMLNVLVSLTAAPEEAENLKEARKLPRTKTLPNAKKPIKKGQKAGSLLGRQHLQRPPISGLPKTSGKCSHRHQSVSCW